MESSRSGQGRLRRLDPTYIGPSGQADQRIESDRPPDHCTKVESFWIGTP